MWNLKYDINEFMDEMETQTQRTVCWLLREKEVWEGWSGSLGLTDANYYIQNRYTTRSYYIAQGTIFNILDQTTMKKNITDSVCCIPETNTTLQINCKIKNDQPSAVLLSVVFALDPQWLWETELLLGMCYLKWLCLNKKKFSPHTFLLLYKFVLIGFPVLPIM